MARFSLLAGAALAVATVPFSLIAQQQGRVTRDGIGRAQLTIEPRRNRGD
jgi:hypothetical protein